ncbi:MAG TPA: acyltransferase [Ohtaekwangia sp.]|uniref:acyltransferase family protein n=1 Tax=Ohtaekwangia sp. TaxID=2066019 RepID=UPI002F94EC9C
MSNKSIYFSGLNGLRAISAIAVVVSHTTLSLKEFNLDPFLFGVSQEGKPQGLSLAGYGVSIFFVLSGFLITFLLQTEKDIQDINIKNFYTRRILRIWPLYYLYIGLYIVTMLIYGICIDWQTLLYYILPAANIPFITGGSTVGLLSHYWSLGVEEQFYLFWPWLNKKATMLLSLAITLIIILISAKTVLHLFYPNSIWEVSIHITRFHCMLIGAAGALLYKNKNTLFLALVNNKLTQSVCWVIIFLVAINKYHIASFIDNEIISVVALCLIIGQIEIKNRMVNLEVGLLDFLGRISFGIYVLHPLLIFFISKLLPDMTIYLPLRYIIVYLLILTTTIFFSYLSYRYFEKYFLNFKTRFEIVKGYKN